MTAEEMQHRQKTITKNESKNRRIKRIDRELAEPKNDKVHKGYKKSGCDSENSYKEAKHGFDRNATKKRRSGQQPTTSKRQQKCNKRETDVSDDSNDCKSEEGNFEVNSEYETSSRDSCR